MAAIEFTGDAERDLIELYLYGVETFGPAQAERYAGALAARIEAVAETPRLGADVGFLHAGARRLISASHAIYYREITGGIRILRILQTRMDPGRHLS